MSVVARPDLELSDFSIAFRTPAVRLESPYTLTSRIYAGGVGIFQGTAGWLAEGASHTAYRNAVRLLQGFHLLLQGFDNEVRLRLPVDWSPILHPLTTASASSVARGQSGLTASIVLADNGMTALRVGDMITLGLRLYQIRGISGNSYSLLPNALPPNNTIEVIQPTFRARLDGNGAAGRTGDFLAENVYEWTELVDPTV